MTKSVLGEKKALPAQEDASKISRNSGVAVWRQIADAIRMQIKQGHFQRGERLPSETVLASEFDVNRHTVRSAIASLTQEGVLRAEQGRGTFIANAKRLTYPISARTRLSTGLAAQVSQTSSVILEHHIERASLLVAKALQLPSDNRIVSRFETLSLADGQPVSRSTSWFDHQRFPELYQDYSLSGSVTAALKKAGVADYLRKSTLISAQHATNDDLLHLKLTPGAIVLTAQAVNVDLRNIPVEFAITRFAADRMEFSIENLPQVKV